MRGMELTENQFRLIEDCLPRQRGNVKITNLELINAILHAVERGCKWRRLPKRFGNWHTIYTRMNRWSKSGVLDRVFMRLQQEHVIHIKLEAVPQGGTIVKARPGGTGIYTIMAREPSKNPERVGRQRFIWLPRMLGAR